MNNQYISIHKLQQVFSEIIRKRLSLSKDSEDTEDFERLKNISDNKDIVRLTEIFQGDIAHIARGCNTYINNTRSTHNQAVMKCYPMTCKILGDEIAKKLVNRFTYANPPTQHDINLYGGNFSDFIKSQHSSLLYDFPYLIDLINIEWLRYSLYYTHSTRPSYCNDWSQLDTLNPANVALVPAQALQQYHSQWALCSLWGAAEFIEKANQYLLFIRDSDFIIRTFELNDEQWLMFKDIQNNIDLNQLYKRYRDKVNTFLPYFIRHSWIIGFKTQFTKNQTTEPEKRYPKTLYQRTPC